MAVLERQGAQHSGAVQVSGVYMMMGRGLERLQHAQAGNIVAIGGLEHAILKSATLSSTSFATPIAPMLFQASLFFLPVPGQRARCSRPSVISLQCSLWGHDLQPLILQTSKLQGSM